jgi:hypothetical protein
MRPKQFLRELFCIAPNGTRYRGRAARLRDCGEFGKRGPLLATGYAHHPYTKNVSPTVRDSHPDSLTMANISELGTTLDELAAKTNNVRPGLPLFMTEFGFETNPPDPFSGVPLASQAEFNTVGEFLAWQNPRILSQAQFLLADVAPIRQRRRGTKGYWFTYQSGLFFQRGQPKPAAFAYTMPFLATQAGADPVTAAPVFNFWGQLRFLPNGARDVAQIQWRPKDNSSGWISVGEPVAIDERGYFTATRVAPAAIPGEWRSAWLRPDGTIGQTSPGTD